jgi:hypothetical protein
MKKKSLKHYGSKKQEEIPFPKQEGKEPRKEK